MSIAKPLKAVQNLITDFISGHIMIWLNNKILNKEI